MARAPVTTLPRHPLAKAQPKRGSRLQPAERRTIAITRQTATGSSSMGALSCPPGSAAVDQLMGPEQRARRGAKTSGIERLIEAAQALLTDPGLEGVNSSAVAEGVWTPRRLAD